MYRYAEEHSPGGIIQRYGIIPTPHLTNIQFQPWSKAHRMTADGYTLCGRFSYEWVDIGLDSEITCKACLKHVSRKEQDNDRKQLRRGNV